MLSSANLFCRVSRQLCANAEIIFFLFPATPSTINYQLSAETHIGGYIDMGCRGGALVRALASTDVARVRFPDPVSNVG